ncbi:MAG TPA: CueP family metal-binding protein [Jiangellaceae bacterium]|nr:CueP family metal-binding protein [Jiangellaceae bacterium]
MRIKLTTRAVAVATFVLAATITGCSTETDNAGIAAPSPSAAEPLLAEYGLEGLGTVEIIDHLDRLAVEERPADLMASVRPSEVVVSSGDEQFNLEIPDDRFYLSVAPYVDQTHDCFHHSLTTCKGELASEEVRVQVVDETSGKVLVDEMRTTFENGFVGLWLPRDIEGTLTVTYDGKVGEVDFATDTDAPTCLTTLQLA